MVSATLMLVVVVPVVAVGTTEMEVVTAKELDRPAAMTLPEAVRVELVAATVAASLKVALKVQASE